MRYFIHENDKYVLRKDILTQKAHNVNKGTFSNLLGRYVRSTTFRQLDQPRPSDVTPNSGLISLEEIISVARDRPDLFKDSFVQKLNKIADVDSPPPRKRKREHKRSTAEPSSQRVKRATPRLMEIDMNHVDISGLKDTIATGMVTINRDEATVTLFGEKHTVPASAVFEIPQLGQPKPFLPGTAVQLAVYCDRSVYPMWSSVIVLDHDPDANEYTIIRSFKENGTPVKFKAKAFRLRPLPNKHKCVLVNV